MGTRFVASFKTDRNHHKMKLLLLTLALVSSAQAISFTQAVDTVKISWLGMKAVMSDSWDYLTGDSEEPEVIPEQLPLDPAWPPEFCNDIDCPKFTVVTTTNDYEERNYEASHWVSATSTGYGLNEAYLKMFMKLFRYISGNNENEEKIAMTAPVLITQGPACENNFTMSFYISPKVGDAPAPTDATVFLSSMPEMTVYVRSFTGFASNADYAKNAADLAAALPKTAKYNKDMYYTGGYNSPFTLFNRHNEVWFIGTK